MNAPSLTDRTFERILLIKPSAFGDVIHTLPVLVKLRTRYPNARIDWLVTPENAELVRIIRPCPGSYGSTAASMPVSAGTGRPARTCAGWASTCGETATTW